MVCCNHSAVGVDVLQLILIAKKTRILSTTNCCLITYRCMLPSSTQYLFGRVPTYCNYCNRLVRPTFNCMLANLSLHVPPRCHGHKLNDCSHLENCFGSMPTSCNYYNQFVCTTINHMHANLLLHVPPHPAFANKSWMSAHILQVCFHIWYAITVTGPLRLTFNLLVH